MGLIKFGENNSNSKLREVDVLRIREFFELHPDANMTHTAKLFGVCQNTISRIKNGHRWKKTLSKNGYSILRTQTENI